MESWITIALINLATVSAVMTTGWIFVLRHNVTIVDSLWSLGLVQVTGVR